ncbi:MAG: CDP-alcohol phosphatidyltransferase family protein, partial [Candidatus Omnitrophica bacterium]|nr:CDP-alcohol phosphatidyltransferase family protein [Candidatus Omnitrophota bacterium]
MNIANRLTVLRILLTFVFMFFLFVQGLWAKVIALTIFIFAALSDFLDGRIAQKKN